MIYHPFTSIKTPNSSQNIRLLSSSEDSVENEQPKAVTKGGIKNDVAISTSFSIQMEEQHELKEHSCSILQWANSVQSWEQEHKWSRSSKMNCDRFSRNKLHWWHSAFGSECQSPIRSQSLDWCYWCGYYTTAGNQSVALHQLTTQDSTRKTKCQILSKVTM